MRITIHGKVVGFRDAQYSKIVVETCENPITSFFKHIMMTVCPNWQGTLPKLGDVGYFEFEEVSAGEKYYNRETGEESEYQFPDNYFITFVEEPKIIESQKEFKF